LPPPAQSGELPLSTLKDTISEVLKAQNHNHGHHRRVPSPHFPSVRGQGEKEV
jgi:hypothetical protein